MMDIWYASYGSNMMKDRFLAYIVGGFAPKSSSPEKGCRDLTLPKEDEIISIPYPLYFAKERSKWGDGGVAFIGTAKSNEEYTIGRMYLIKKEQFFDVVSQENNGLEVTIDLNEVEEKGFVDIHSGWYNRIIFLGRKNGAPIFTFSNSNSLNTIDFYKPSTSYLSVIAEGLRELGLSKEEIINYLLHTRGIKEVVSKPRLIEMLEEESK
ncbi:hypothetical protein GCM10008025_06970 [Ornithinibacillus halotolerans]|uniref:Histone deacetylase n=2 Tax=Ornithinibacillus halotolerans TaxID=1274357 RepID=A0A916W4W8_9BACI|nr:hypothetical protein GCM10008025_06970 [Ornithinibacillus halotolerans]